jgi:hypothetical protein
LEASSLKSTNDLKPDVQFEETVGVARHKELARHDIANAGRRLIFYRLPIQIHEIRHRRRADVALRTPKGVRRKRADETDIAELRVPLETCRRRRMTREGCTHSMAPGKRRLLIDSDALMQRHPHEPCDRTVVPSLSRSAHEDRFVACSKTALLCLLPRDRRAHCSA